MNDLDRQLAQIREGAAGLSNAARAEGLAVSKLPALRKSIEAVAAEVDKLRLDVRIRLVGQLLKGRKPDELKKLFSRQHWRYPAMTGKTTPAAILKAVSAVVPAEISEANLGSILRDFDGEQWIDFSAMSLDQVRMELEIYGTVAALLERLPPAYRPRAKPKSVMKLREAVLALVRRGREASGFHGI